MHPIIRFVTTILVLLAVQSGFANANCYYPDGSLSNLDAPCGDAGDGVACCPLGWSCLSNGLCWLEAESYLGRYTCTDRTWASDGCPNVCLGEVSNGTDHGNVAIDSCSGVTKDTYCCNGDRSGHCCEDKDPSYFLLDEGKSLMTITAMSEKTTTASSTKLTSVSTSSERSTTVHGVITTIRPPPPPFTSESGSPSTSSSTDAATSVITSIVSNPSDGAISTVYLTATAAPSANSSSSASTRANTGTIVGCAVGIPICLGLAGLLAFFLLRRRRQQAIFKRSFPPLPTLPDGDEKARVTELDGFPRATGGSIGPPSPRTAWPRGSSGPPEFYGGRANRHSHAASEADGTPIPIPKRIAELDTPSPKPFELEATESGTHAAGLLHGPAARTVRVSPDPRGYAVGGATPGGLHVVNAVDGELDSEVESSPPQSGHHSWRVGSWGRGNAGGGRGASARSSGWAPSPTSTTTAAASSGGAVADGRSPVSPLPDGTGGYKK